MELYWIEVTFLIGAIATAAIGLAVGQVWAHNSWLIPVLVALMWGVLQDRTL